MSKTMQFNTEQEAFAWMYNELEDESYIDNDRFAFIDDEEGMLEYRRKVDDGCCGYFDAEIFVDGRLATIGCNYGH